jgi:hypothetical protein
VRELGLGGEEALRNNVLVWMIIVEGVCSGSARLFFVWRGYEPLLLLKIGT